MNRDKQIILRPGKLSDVPLLCYWDEKPHVIASGAADEDWDWEKELAHDPVWREQLMSELDGRPIGFVQIIDPLLEETHYWGEVPPHLRAIDIWIGEEEDLGKGYGSEMMRQAFGRCFAPPEVEAILIDPLTRNTAAHRFYERLGFVFVENRDFYGDDCKVYRLSRKDWLKAAASSK
ncbi:MAG: GNAT family N-acetyltransferase [Bacteroidia bacterium]